MRLVGIDAGGTKTDFLLCDENESILNRVTLGSGNPNDIGIDALLALLCEGLDALCGEASPDAIFAGVSGGGFGENAEKIRDLLQSRYPDAAVGNGTDALNLIGCSNYDDNVGALICGTGSALFILDGGELFRYGGWGHLFDNGGSAYDIGRDALRELLKAEENGVSPLSDSLFSLLGRALGSSAHTLIPKLYSLGKPYIASFAPIVFTALEQGSPIAREIIDSNADLVADRVSLALSRHLNINELVCAGGLFNSSVFFDALKARISIPLYLPDCPPSLGAVRLAKKL